MTDALQAASAPQAPRASRAFYAPGPLGYQALPAATGPWDPNFQVGVAISGLLAHLLEREGADPAMDIARFHLDIFKPASMATPLKATTSVVREGRRMRVTEATLVSGGETVARASVVRLRLAETPDIADRAPPPAPESLDLPPMPTRRPVRGLLHSKLQRGGIETLGPGAAWLRYDADIVEGAPISPFVAAAMMSDYGSALSSVLDWRDFTYANVDISLNLTRAPREAWIHLASETVTHGHGRALVNTILSDRHGEFARAHQTLFVDPRR